MLNNAIVRGLLCGLFIFSCVCIIVGCIKGDKLQYCDELRQTASSSEVQKYLTDWVDNSLEAAIATNDFSYGGGMVPGQYSVPDMDFDWSMLNMEGGVAQIRIVTGLTLEKKPVLSVSFSEISRRSILVRVLDSKGFGIKNSAHLSEVSDRIAVYCNQ